MGFWNRLLGIPEEAPTPKDGRTKIEIIDKSAPYYWHTWNGDVYENMLARSAIEATTRHIQKLQVGFKGSAQPKLQTRLKKAPNSWQTWSQFLARLNNILEVQGTAIICPIFDDYGEIVGLTTVVPLYKEVRLIDDEYWVRLKVRGFEGKEQWLAIELSKIGIMVNHQYKSDFWGTDNAALNETMELLDLQAQAAKVAVKGSTKYQFMAQVSPVIKDSDVKKEKDRFKETNMNSDDDSGILLFPQFYQNIQQIVPKNYLISTEEERFVRETLLNYFGVNENILQNKATTEELDSFYNGKVEPFAIQLEEVLTRMLFTIGEQGYGAAVIVRANRLQYMTTNEKSRMVDMMTNRGLMTRNEAREVFNLPALPDDIGNVLMARGEYYNTVTGLKMGVDSEVNQTIQTLEVDETTQEGEEDASQEG